MAKLANLWHGVHFKSIKNECEHTKREAGKQHEILAELNSTGITKIVNTGGNNDRQNVQNKEDYFTQII